MLTRAQLAEIDQEVTNLMEKYGHCFGASLREGIEDDSNSSADGTQTVSVNTPERPPETEAPRSWSDGYYHLSPELASHAVALDTHNFMSTHSPWSKAEALMSSSISVTDHPMTNSYPIPTIRIIPPQTANKRSFGEVSGKDLLNVDAPQKRVKSTN
ncbi:hypothetical protein ACHAPU_008814 [Fusarium lateritium]